jgi:hypothetical protein
VAGLRVGLEPEALVLGALSESFPKLLGVKLVFSIEKPAQLCEYEIISQALKSIP